MIRLATRNTTSTTSRESLIALLQTVFSDADTNGNNGSDYWKLSTEKCDDEALYEKYISSSMDDMDIVREYADYYMTTMIDYCRDQEYTVEQDDNGNIIAVAYAYFD